MRRRSTAKGGDLETRVITVDMKNVYNEHGATQYGKIMLGPHPTAKPDVKVNLGADTFDALSRKEIGGFQAFVGGKLTFSGNIGKLKKFNSEVVEKYLYELLVKAN